ncbi:hypothetical protein Taro_019252 [Colocasia esculenta]|uniref:Uncharacterized protein n=1 Tax=Colocasia esculenta TaxID=4460 RepID=A0A843USX8_COLES|nr:hypothetical protein [Colocasia esculenta]
MSANDPCIFTKRRYLETAILKSRDSLLGTCAFSFPSCPLGFTSQDRLPSAIALGSFSRGLDCYVRSRRITPVT